MLADINKEEKEKEDSAIGNRRNGRKKRMTVVAENLTVRIQ